MHIFNLIPPFATSSQINQHPVSIKSSLVMSSSISSMARFNRFISGIKTSWQIDDDNFKNISISVSEALMNAIVHGNKSQNNRMVYINAVRNGKSYTFTVEDEGNGFDYEAVQNPLDPENLLKPNGRGIFIMKHMSDAVRFWKNGKCVQLLFSSK